MKTADRRLLAVRLALALAVLAGLALSDWASFERYGRQAAHRGRALGLAGTQAALIERARAGRTSPELPREAAAVLRRTSALQAVLERENEDAVLELRRWSLVRLAATLTLLLGMSTFILRPLWRALRRDITDRRRMEERLETQSSQLERSNAELQAFASIASHELQEPMRKVVAFGDRLKERCLDRLTPEGREDLERIQKAAHRMVRLVENLLRYARVERDPPAFEPVALGEALEEVLLDLEARVEASAGEVKRAALPEVWGDRSQLEQVFANLLSNALKFARPGVPPRVEIGSRDAGDSWEIRVSDNGIGFEPGYAGLLFEPFSRLHPRDRFEGTGMGLAITRRIVRRHGGEITAEGRPGEGTTFVLRLPKRGPAPARGPASPDGRAGAP